MECNSGMDTHWIQVGLASASEWTLDGVPFYRGPNFSALFFFPAIFYEIDPTYLRNLCVPIFGNVFTCLLFYKKI